MTGHHSALSAVVERLIEVTAKKNPGVSIKKKALSDSPRNIARRKLTAARRKVRCSSTSGSLH